MDSRRVPSGRNRHFNGTWGLINILFGPNMTKGSFSEWGIALLVSNRCNGAYFWAANNLAYAFAQHAHSMLHRVKFDSHPVVSRLRGTSFEAKCSLGQAALVFSHSGPMA